MLTVSISFLMTNNSAKNTYETFCISFLDWVFDLVFVKNITNYDGGDFVHYRADAIFQHFSLLFHLVKKGGLSTLKVTPDTERMNLSVRLCFVVNR